MTKSVEEKEASLTQEAMDTYSGYFGDLQTLNDLLCMALRHPQHERQIKLLQIAVSIASGVGSFTKHQNNLNSGNWQTRQ